MSGPDAEARSTGTIGAVVAAAIALAVFAPSVRFPFVHWDDTLHVTENPLVAHPLAEGWRGLLLTPRLGYPVPVLVLSFAIDRAIFGLQAWAFHAVNVALHLACAFFTWRLGERVGLSARAARWAATLFALHPLVVEPVCWVTGRKDVLSAALLLASLVVATSDRAERWGARVAAACALAALAILTKPSAIVAPALAWLVVRASHPERLRATATRVGLAALAAFCAIAAVLGVSGEGGVGAVRGRSLGEAARDVGGALALQLAHVVAPVSLLPRYFREPGDPPAWAIALAVLAGIALAAVALSPRTPRPARVGLAFAGLAYLPASGLVGLNRWFADSYMYLPLVGLAWSVVAIAGAAWPARRERAGGVLAWTAAGVLALLSVGQSLVWRSSSSLWPNVVARYPQVPRAWALQASGLLADGRDADATRIYVMLHDRFPEYDGAIVNQVYAYEKLGDKEATPALWRRCLELAKPTCVEVFWNRLLVGSPPIAPTRDVLAIAFDHGEAVMAEKFRDPSAWRRFAEVLRGAGLEDQARRCDARAAGP